MVCASAGNHAQGVALSSNQLNIKATIVMPEATPKIKVNAVRAFGGDNVNLVLHGKTYDEAATEANRISLETGAAMIHPFDDAEVIAGQGTIGMEILKVSDFNTLFLSFFWAFLNFLPYCLGYSRKTY